MGLLNLTEALPQASPDWPAYVPCKGQTEYFFPPPNETYQELNNRVAVAQSICAMCVVAEPCYNGAASRREKEGIWGGVDFVLNARQRENDYRRQKRLELKAQALDLVPAE